MSRLGRELLVQGRLALPLCMAHVGQQLMSTVDAIMLGHYSDAALAGGGIGTGLYSVITCLGMGTLFGLDALIPQALGGGKPSLAWTWLRSGYRLATVLGVTLSVVLAASPILLGWLDVHPEVARQATLYTWARTPALLPFLWFTAARSFLQAHELTRPILMATVVGNIINIPLNGILIFGDDALQWCGLPGLGCPALGTTGAALSSALVTIAMMFMVVAAARTRIEADGGHHCSAKKIVSIGWPVGLHLFAEVGLFAGIAVLAGRLGPKPAAAHQVAVSLGSLTFSLAIGIGAAAAVRVGRAIGAGDQNGVRLAGLAALITGVTLMGSFGLLFITVPRVLIGLFTDDSTVIQLAVPLLAIAALFQISDATQAVLAGALRGAGDNQVSFFANLFGSYIVGFPLAIYLAFFAGMGATGLWWGLSASLTVVAVILGLRFRWRANQPLTLA